MAYQNNATAIVVMFEIVIPRSDYIIISEGSIYSHWLACDSGPKRGQRHLPVERRVDAALRAESRELRSHHCFLFRSSDHVAVGRRVIRDCWVYIEAINRRIRIWGPCFARQFTIRGNDGSG